MSFFSQFAGGPAKVTEYNTGSGNYVPISTNLSWARLTLVGGGGGGGGAAYNANNGNFDGTGSGGGGGGFTQVWIKLNAANYAYAVGAAGNGGAGKFGGNSGGNTTFGNFFAGGGGGGNSTFNAQQGWRQNPGYGGSGTVPGGQGGAPWSHVLGNLNATNVAPNTPGNADGQSGGIFAAFNPNISNSAGSGSVFGYGGTNGAGVGGAGGSPNAGSNAGKAGYISIEEFIQG